MKRTLLVAIALMLAGCVSETSSHSPKTSGEPSASAANETQPAMPVPSVTVSAPTFETKEETGAVFVNTTAPIGLTILVNGNETARTTLSTSGILEVPLEFGANKIQIAASGPGFAQEYALDIVRLGATTLNVDYGVFHPAAQGAPRSETFEVWINIDSRPSAPSYAEQGITHIDAFTAHDQLVVFEQATGKVVVYEYFPSFQGFGVSRIDGAGSPVSSDAPPWWCYNVNGAAADGISIQQVSPGDVVSWELGSCT